MLGIQHTVTQGSSPDDGGAYDNLSALGVNVTVVDDEASDVLSVAADPSSGAPDNTLIVAEDPPTPAGDLPVTDATMVVLTHKPTGPVDIKATSDGQTLVCAPAQHADACGDAGEYATSLTLSFDDTNWSSPQKILIKAHSDTLKEGLHFSRITRRAHLGQGRVPRPVACRRRRLPCRSRRR